MEKEYKKNGSSTTNLRKDNNDKKVNVTTGRPKITGRKMSALIWTKRVDILADRGDSYKHRFHLKALILELQVQRGNL